MLGAYKILAPHTHLTAAQFADRIQEGLESAEKSLAAAQAETVL